MPSARGCAGEDLASLVLISCWPLVVRAFHFGGGIDHRVQASRVICRSLVIHAGRHPEIFLEPEDRRTWAGKQDTAEALAFLLQQLGGHWDRPLFGHDQSWFNHNGRPHHGNSYFHL